MRQQQVAEPFTLFYSYAHEDELLREQLEKHLHTLVRQGIISEWHDRRIVAGTEWAEQIDEHLETASIILLLISPDFLASDYCYDCEMKRALERHRRNEACVIPIILRPCEWHEAPLARLQSLPRDGKPVTEWDNQDAAFLDIAQGLRQAIKQQSFPLDRVSRWSSTAKQNRLRLLKKVRQTWIEGVLEQSLHEAPLITLNLQEQPDALANPWHLEVQETDLPPRPLPADIPIAKVYDDAAGELLILGEPGAGKTTLLLQLARDLLSRAEQDETYPLPVIFHLSSWVVKRQTFIEWFIEELAIKYKVPRKFARMLVEDDKILLLLDGLDEVELGHRATCIHMINQYQRDHGLVSLVVCSRKNEYFVLNQSFRLHLSRAIVIQPLTDNQIRNAFSESEHLQDAYYILNKDSVLQKLMTTPLILDVFIRAYREQPFTAKLPISSYEERLRQIFATYVQRMLQRRSVGRYTPQQTERWLSWLAKQMVQRNQIEFFPKQVQPDWLPSSQFYFYYHGLVRVVGGLISWILSGLLIGLIYGLLPGIIIGAFIGLIFGLLLARDETHRRIPVKRVGASWGRYSTVYGMGNGLIEIIIPIIALISELLGKLVGDLAARWVSIGQVSLKQTVLHILLWRAGCIPGPSQYIRFLDYATERLLLHKVGDGYIFIHRLLLDYFAGLEKKGP